MHNKRGQEFGINSAVLIVIVIIVLGIIVAGVSMGWENLTAWIQPDTVSITAGKCSTSCGVNNQIDFCSSPKSFKASRATVRAVTSDEALATYNLSYKNEQKLFQSVREEYLKKTFEYQIYNTSAGIYQIPTDYNPTKYTHPDNNSINISDFLKNKGVTDPENYLSPSKLIKLIPKAGEEGYLKSNAIFPELFALDASPTDGKSIKFKSLDSSTGEDTELRNTLIELAKDSATRNYLTAAKNLMYYMQVKEKEGSITGIKVNEFSCAALSEHPVWKEYFKKCREDNLLCEGKSAASSSDLETYLKIKQR